MAGAETTRGVCACLCDTQPQGSFQREQQCGHESHTCDLAGLSEVMHFERGFGGMREV